MKKLTIATACIIGLFMVSILPAKADISDKVLKSFHTVFNKAHDIKWAEYPDYYSVSFKQNDVLFRVNYDLKGNIMNSIRYYKEQLLPLNILYNIKKSYPSKSINVVTELSNQEGIVYMVQLKDKKEYVTVRAEDNGSMKEVDRFKNANNE